MKKLDNLHYDYSKINGYHVLFYVVISARDPGKTTMKILDCYREHKRSGAGFVFITRQVNDISEGYLNSFQEVINDFIDPEVELTYKKGTISDGLTDIRVKGEDEIFIRVQGLSKKINAQKRYRMSNIKDIVFDEFICNPKFNESYLPGEYEKFREVIKTYQKDNPALRVYMLGNPYSLYNPYFAHWEVNTNKLRIGHFYTDKKTYVIDFYKMKDELREKLISENPDYLVDEDYADYVLNGNPINDRNIRLVDTCPPSFELRYVFKIGKKYIGCFCYSNPQYNNSLFFDYYIQYIDFEPSKRRSVTCFEFDDIMTGSILIASSDRWKYDHLKKCIRSGRVAFQNVELYYLIEEVYKQL